MGKLKYKVRKLVSSVGGAPTIDPQLLNAWGIAVEKDALWVAAADGHVVEKFAKDGNKLASISVNDDSPTGIVINKSKGFVVNGSLGSASSEWITVTEEGKIYAYSPLADPNAVLESDDSAEGASYKGIAQSGDVIYVANFAELSIDVYDHNWEELEGYSFVDPNLPEGYSPFNVAVICDKIYVLYAVKEEDGDDEVAGPGLGIVSVFDLNGNFIKRLINNGGQLNAPWGIVKAPKCFGKNAGKLIIGNFGDGSINVYDFDGTFISKLQSCSGNIFIDGLWGLAANCNKIFYAAGPEEESQGEVGVIKPTKC